MRLAVFYPHNPTSAWSVSQGLAETLQRMGNDVVFCPIKPGRSISRTEFPELEALNECDAVVVSGPEHIRKYLIALYPWEKVAIPKLGWLHESVRREDYGQLDVEAIKRTADFVFCPARQDEEFGFDYLPFGVDTAMFAAGNRVRDIPLAFIGMMYPKREEWMRTHRIPELRIGRCEVTDLDGINVEQSARVYAEQLRRIKVFLNLPSLSQLAVTKVYEAMACGAALITPPVKDSGFVSGEHLMFYEDNPAGAIEALRDDAFREKLAKAGCGEVHAKHSLESRLGVMLQKLAVAA